MKTTSINSPAAAATGTQVSGDAFTDKRGFASRYQLSKRTVDAFLRDGMPHLKIGQRRVRIVVAEADAWMRERFSTRRN